MKELVWDLSIFVSGICFGILAIGALGWVLKSAVIRALSK